LRGYRVNSGYWVQVDGRIPHLTLHPEPSSDPAPCTLHPRFNYFTAFSPFSFSIALSAPSE